MSFSVRIFSAYFLLIGFAIWFFTQSVTEEVLPGMRHSLEEVLVETSNLLAEMVNQDFESADFGKNNFATSVDAYKARKLSAQIWFLKKKDPSLIVYITDKNGIVRYDSRGFDLGKDYSQWNDVYLTLRGGYGARTTRYNPNDESTSVMFVAAPILKNQTIIGVLTVGKPSKTV
ncbi:MAG: two-component system sensor histidine kinase CreC, partial [Gammaproteobacteria bacterium]|nr:two-component system sensor histidine kinase CreC [Gammaproteobacteria bacterium]